MEKKSLKEFLPIGSVVLVAGGKEKLMIIGQKQMKVDTKREFDYAAIVAPEDTKILTLFVTLIEKKLYIFFKWVL